MALMIYNSVTVQPAISSNPIDPIAALRRIAGSFSGLLGPKRRWRQYAGVRLAALWQVTYERQGSLQTIADFYFTVEINTRNILQRAADPSPMLRLLILPGLLPSLPARAGADGGGVADDVGSKVLHGCISLSLCIPLKHHMAYYSQLVGMIIQHTCATYLSLRVVYIYIYIFVSMFVPPCPFCPETPPALFISEIAKAYPYPTKGQSTQT